MEQTRSALAEKLETLEDHVTSTVRNTTEAVTGTVEAVKGAVEDTVDTVKGAVSDSVETVKETFDLNRQMQEHPWLMLGGGVLVGYLGSCLLQKGMSSVSREAARAAPAAPPIPFTSESRGDGRNRPVSDRTESMWDKLADTLGPAADKLKGLALGAATALAGRMILESVPDVLRGEVEQVIDELTQSVGGKSLPGLLHPNPAETRATAPPARW